MGMITYEFDLDMVPGGRRTEVNLNQYDEDFELKINLVARQGTFSVQSGTTAAIRGTKPDGNGFSADCTLEGTVVTVTGDQQMTAVAGKAVFELTLYRSGKELNTANFTVHIERAALDKDTVISKSQTRELVEIEDNAEELIAAAESMRQSQSEFERLSREAADSAAAAKESEENAAETLTTYNKKYSDDMEDFDEAYDAAMKTINDKSEAIAQLTTDAGTVSKQALDMATNAQNDTAEFSTQVAAMKNSQTRMDLALAETFNGAYVENGSIYFTHDGEVVAGPFSGMGGGGSGGGGGSSSGNNAVITVQNTSGWQAKTIADGSECVTKVTWSSIEDENATGPGTLHIYVNGVVKAVLNVQQGEVAINIADYLTVGANVVKETIYDTYGNNRTINFSVEKVAISISSSFDSSTPYQGAISFPYIPVGSVQKTVYFILDGKVIDSTVTSVSGRAMSFTIPAQSHGPHTFECYFEATINGQTVESNRLYFEIICLETLNTTPIIVSDFNRTEVNQYETLLVTYTVYDPVRMEAPVTIKVNDRTVQTLTVDRTAQTFSYRADVVGTRTIEISSGTTKKSITFDVAESDIHPEAVTDKLVLNMNSAGRSNSEENPAVWTDLTGSDIAAVLSGFNWTSDGWIIDEKGQSCLRIMSGASVSIPALLYENDFRTNGKTIEIEFATHDVLDYDVPIISCMSGDRGFEIAADHAVFKSARSEVSARYTTDSQIRLTLCVQPQTKNRLVYLYINGEYAGITQYSGTDSFRQADPVGISIGNAMCGVDIYNIRVYDRDLTADEILDNYIADRQLVAEMLSLYRSNDIKDEYGNIVIEKLDSALPYAIFTGPESPQFKGDKKNVAMEYVEPTNSARHLVADGVQVNVQGTSSQYYMVKNLKITFKNGATVNGTLTLGFTIREGAIVVDTFTLKADVASSESANNIVLAKLYDDLSRELGILTPAQKKDKRTRQGMDGFPCVVFWDYGDGPEFVGKYNFNNDKGTPETFGFSDGDEAWDIRSNTSQLTKFHTNVFNDNWATEDMESIFPEEYTDDTLVRPMVDFLYSTWQDAATGEALAEPVTFDGVEYTADTAEYRLAKFKAGYPDLYDIDNAAFYYVFTLVNLMVDSRQKNEHLVYWKDLGKWWEFIYDCDTALGNDNRGNLTFEYWMEDIDMVNGEYVFNGADNVKWVNFRQVFWDRAKAMYQRMRSSGKFGAEYLKKIFADWQSAWAKMIWNEDGDYKYVKALRESGTTEYLTMAYGSKLWQRNEFLEWRFPYCDSMFDVGEALLSITFRPYYQVTEEQRAAGAVDIDVEVYKKSYVTVLWDDAKVSKRMIGDNPVCHVENPLSFANDAVCGIHNAKMIKGVYGLENLYIGFWDSTNAPNLQNLQLGKADASYVNTATKTVSVGANRKLRTVDLRGCTAFGTDDQKTLDLSQCPNIWKVYLDRTSALGVDLPNGSPLEVLHLPATVTSIVLRNHLKLTELEVASYAHVDQLWLENMDHIDTKAMLKAVPASTAVRITGFYWEATGAEEIEEIFDILDTMNGLEINGQGNVEEVAKAQMSGTIHTNSLTGAEIAGWLERYPSINVVADHTTSYRTYANQDGSLIRKVTCIDGVPQEAAPTGLTKPNSSDGHYSYSFVGWSKSMNATTADSDALDNVQEDRTVYAAFSETVRKYTVTWKNADGTTLRTDSNVAWGTTPSWGQAMPTNSSGETAKGWSPTPSAITGNTTYTATYIPTYTVYFYNGSTLLEQHTVQQGASATYTGSSPVYTGTGDPDDYEFSGWSPSPTNIQANTSCYAQFSFTGVVNTISDDLATLMSNCSAGNVSGYSIGDTKKFSMGTMGNMSIQLIAKSADELADGSGNAHTTWLMYYALPDSHRMNPANNNNAEGTGSIGGWDKSEMKQYVLDTVVPNLPSEIRNAVKTVKKYTRIYNTSGSAQNDVMTEETFWLPSRHEMFDGTSSSYETKGPRYSEAFPDNASRVKSKVGASSASWWWLRSAYDYNSFNYVGSDGSNPNYSAYNSGAVVLGFCI